MTKRLSRRDAIKLLGAAAGATVLANLPSKWNKPELASGVLPAHAQTSTSVFHTLICDADQFFEPDTDNLSSGVTINPPDSGIVMRWSIAFQNAAFDGPNVTTGIVVTDGTGRASYTTVSTVTSNFGVGEVAFGWSFENPADGTGICEQRYVWGN